MFLAATSEIAALDDAALVAEFDRVESEIRRLTALQAAVVSAIERRSIPAGSGHGSTAAWVRARVNGAPGEATAIVRLARLVHEHPVVGEALHDGRIGRSHAAPLARARRNPRCGQLLGDVVDLLVDNAATLPFDDFKTCVARWLQLADADGALRDDDLRHESRTATVAADFDGGAFVHATGSSAAAIELSEIFDRFVEAEFLADWDACVAAHGPLASHALLDRTDAQRRFDALLAIFRAAASAPLDHASPLPIVNIVVDEATFTAHLAAATSGQRTIERDPIEALRAARCETIDGRPVLPGDAVAAAMIGHVRRVVYDTDGVVIDLGRRQRLFVGAARDAAQLQGRRCFHPGCSKPVQRCQIDHIHPWAAGGTTSPGNARVACGKHNRWLNLGYPVSRDADGNWRIDRPLAA